MVSNSKYQHVSKEILDEQVEEYFETNLPRWELSKREIDDIWFNRISWDSYELLRLHFIKAGKSPAAIYIASRLWNERPEFPSGGPDLQYYINHWRIHKRIASVLSREEVSSMGCSYLDLINLGIKHEWEAEAFHDMYSRLKTPNRSWGSCYQIPQGKILQIVRSPQLRCLPDWVIKIICKENLGWDHSRPGRNRDLIHAAKAWKWAPGLPKKLAARVGALSLKARVLARAAWSCTGREGTRSEIREEFWKNLNGLLVLPPLEQFSYLEQEDCSNKQYRTVLEILTGLPHGSVQYLDPTRPLSALRATVSPRETAQIVLGCSGKATTAAFASSEEDNWKWASNLFYGKADLIQRVLNEPFVIGYEPDSTYFLNSLPTGSVFKLLTQRGFKYRGEYHELDPNLVRDTGYLWSNIKNHPDIGRVRCWFSVHAALAAAFVKELPDEPLDIHPAWERLDGLSAVDKSWELEFPRSVAILKWWGESQRNCVGGYGPAIKSRRSVVFAVKQHGDVTHVVEYVPHRDSWSCRQFYSYGNGVPDPRIKEEVTGAVTLAFP